MGSFFLQACLPDAGEFVSAFFCRCFLCALSCARWLRFLSLCGALADPCLLDLAVALLTPSLPGGRGRSLCCGWFVSLSLGDSRGSCWLVDSYVSISFFCLLLVLLCFTHTCLPLFLAPGAHVAFYRLVPPFPARCFGSSSLRTLFRSGLSLASLLVWGSSKLPSSSRVADCVDPHWSSGSHGPNFLLVVCSWADASFRICCVSTI